METNYHFEVDARLAVTPNNPLRTCVFVFGSLVQARKFADDLLMNEPVISIVIYRYCGGSVDGVVETLSPRPLSRVYFKRLNRNGK